MMWLTLYFHCMASCSGGPHPRQHHYPALSLPLWFTCLGLSSLFPDSHFTILFMQVFWGEWCQMLPIHIFHVLSSRGNLSEQSESVNRLSLSLCNPMDCSLPTSSVHGILQARRLEWVAIPSSRGSSWLRKRGRLRLTCGWAQQAPPGTSAGHRFPCFTFCSQDAPAGIRGWL